MSLVLYVVAAVLFVLAVATNGTAGLDRLDLIAAGLALTVLALAVSHVPTIRD